MILCFELQVPAVMKTPGIAYAIALATPPSDATSTAQGRTANAHASSSSVSREATSM
jgi:hypothetical protein